MKMKITILEDSVIESERLKNGIRKYGTIYPEYRCLKLRQTQPSNPGGSRNEGNACTG